MILFFIIFSFKTSFHRCCSPTFMHIHILDKTKMRCLTTARLGMLSFIWKSFHLKKQLFVNEMRALPAPRKIWRHGRRVKQDDIFAGGIDHIWLRSLVTSRRNNHKQHIEDAPTMSLIEFWFSHYALCHFWLNLLCCFPNMQNGRCRVPLTNDMITKPPAMTLVQTVE